jgi:Protein of unknown function (DUF2950)
MSTSSLLVNFRSIPTLIRRPVLAAILLFAASPVANSQQYFETPNDAASALVSAVRKGAPNAILTVLGRNGRDIVSSGDNVADAEMRQRFLVAYDEQNQIAMDGHSKAILVIGKEAFPFPIPLVRVDRHWRFDTVAGRQEILYRRIGRNELHAIQTSLAYVDAQYEYAEKDRTGAGAGVYARRFVSRPGRRDGLYWPTSQGEEPSPLGDLVAQASDEGYQIGGARAPFHGYFYRILTKQAPAARGGAMDYVLGGREGRMIGGFALVAYPAEYRKSGVMTFIVNHDGVVFQKDLGQATTGIAFRMNAFNPERTWSKADVSGLSQ